MSVYTAFTRSRDVLPITTWTVILKKMAHWQTIGWQNRRGLSDYRILFNYMIPSADGRIIIGGSDSKYYHNDGIAPGNNKSVSQEIVKDLTRTFPSLAGIKVEHAWGGPTAGSLHTNRRQNYRRFDGRRRKRIYLTLYCQQKDFLCGTKGIALIFRRLEKNVPGQCRQDLGAFLDVDSNNSLQVVCLCIK